MIVYCGRFDPIHAGHMAVAMHAAGETNQKVILMPTRHPPHKGCAVGYELRYEAVRLAVQYEEDLDVMHDSSSADQPSYTVPILQNLRATHSLKSTLMILGSDAALQLASWHRATELCQHASLLIYSRTGSDDATLQEALAPLGFQKETVLPTCLESTGKFYPITWAGHPASSTQVRKSCGEGTVAWEQWIPASAVACVRAFYLDVARDGENT